jgi:hypothetical protein
MESQIKQRMFGYRTVRQAPTSLFYGYNRPGLTIRFPTVKFVLINEIFLLISRINIVIH